MQIEALIKAVQMLGVDVSNLSANLALTKGQLDLIQERAQEVNTNVWGQPSEGETSYMQVPMEQYQAVLRLLDAVS